MMNLGLDRGLVLAQAPVPVPAAAVANQGAATQEVAQIPAASQILTLKSQRRRMNHKTRPTLMGRRYGYLNN